MIPVPFGMPDGDITMFISDWYIRDHKVRLCSFMEFQIRKHGFLLESLWSKLILQGKTGT